jgi:hypothetical protein
MKARGGARVRGGERNRKRERRELNCSFKSISLFFQERMHSTKSR